METKAACEGMKKDSTSSCGKGRAISSSKYFTIEGPDQRMGGALENAEKYSPRCNVTRESKSLFFEKKIEN